MRVITSPPGLANCAISLARNCSRRKRWRSTTLADEREEVNESAVVYNAAVKSGKLSLRKYRMAVMLICLVVTLGMLWCMSGVLRAGHQCRACKSDAESAG